MTNFVGLLQEKCQQHNKHLPLYLDDGDQQSCQIKICTLKLGNWTIKGSGCSKKLARQNAAELMLKKAESENYFLVSETKSVSISAISKLDVFSVKNGKAKPLFSDLPNEGDLVVVDCTFDGFTATGRGRNKKVAKELATEAVVKHFDIDTFYENFLKSKERKEIVKHPMQKFMEYCQSRKLTPEFYENKVDCENPITFTMTCMVKNLITKSQPNFSKKNAKIEAATLMYEKLQDTKLFDTPEASPRRPQSPIHFEEPKRLLPEFSSGSEDDDYNEPLAKRKLLN